MDYKDLFYEDSIEKQVKITSDDGLINITNEELDGENMELTESLCTEEQLTFGSCSAAMLKFTVSNVMVPMKGAWLNVDIGLSGMEDYRLGRYKVDSDKPTADRLYRDVIAYDALYDAINVNVADWYNALLPDSDSTVNLRQLRDSFFTYFGIEQENVALPNDNMLVERTILPSQFSGATVINCICEVNGCMGHINREGKFEYVYLMPIEDNTQEISKSLYTTATYEDYEVRTIDKLQIRQEENDIGVIVGTGTNAYIIEDNFLLYGKSTEELKPIAENIFTKIQGLVYRPYKVECIGNPCIMPGDAVSISSTTAVIKSYVLSRTINGVQSFKDSYEAAGSEMRSEQVNSVNRQIEQLKGQSNVLKREIELNKATISDVEQGLKNDIEQTSNRFAVEIEALQSQVDGDVKQYNVDYEPTLLNYPAWDFTYNIPCNNTVQLRNDLKFIYKDSYYSKNARSVVFNYATSMSYRFVKEDDVWYWKPIGDTEFGVAMSKIAKLEVTTEDISTQVRSLDKKITNDYITTADCNTKINQISESIKLEANATYATKTMLGDYATTAKMNAAITVAASGIKQEVSEDYATKTSLSQTEQKADKITWLIKSGTSAANMTFTAEMYKLLADNIVLSGKHITLDGDTVVSTGFTLSCDRLKGGEINGQRIIGCTITGGAASFGGNNIILNEGGVWVIGDGSAGAPSYAVNNRGEIVQYWNDGIRRFYSNGLTVKGTWVTHFDEYTASSNWYQICIAANNTSDKRQKNNIKSLDDENNLNQLFDELKPSAFYYNKDSGYIETQRHLGFIAQDVEEAIETAGIEYDMALFDHMDEDKLGVNKQELIALCVWQIQKLKKQVSMLTDKMAELIMNKEAADA